MREVVDSLKIAAAKTLKGDVGAPDRAVDYMVTNKAYLKPLMKGVGKVGASTLGLLLGKYVNSLSAAETIFRDVTSNLESTIREEFMCTTRLNSYQAEDGKKYKIETNDLVNELFCRWKDKRDNPHNLRSGHNVFSDEQIRKLALLVGTLHSSGNKGYKVFTDKQYEKIQSIQKAAICTTAITQGFIAAGFDMAIDGTFEGLELSQAVRQQITNEAKEIAKNKIETDAKTAYLTDLGLDVETAFLAVGSVFVGYYVQGNFVKNLTENKKKQYNLLQADIINKKNKLFELQNKLSHLNPGVDYEKEKEKQVVKEYQFYFKRAQEIMNAKEEKLDQAERANARENESFVEGLSRMFKREKTPEKRPRSFESNVLNISLRDGRGILINYPLKLKQDRAGLKGIIQPEDLPQFLEALHTNYEYLHPKPTKEYADTLRYDINNLRKEIKESLDQIDAFIETNNKGGAESTKKVIKAAREIINTSCLEFTEESEKSSQHHTKKVQTRSVTNAEKATKGNTKGLGVRRYRTRRRNKARRRSRK
jgi:hypothetical protein